VYVIVTNGRISPTPPICSQHPQTF